MTLKKFFNWLNANAKLTYQLGEEYEFRFWTTVSMVMGIQKRSIRLSMFLRKLPKALLFQECCKSHLRFSGKHFYEGRTLGLFPVFSFNLLNWDFTGNNWNKWMAKILMLYTINFRTARQDSFAVRSRTVVESLVNWRDMVNLNFSG